MRQVQCETCSNPIQLDSEILSRMAVDEPVKFACPGCGSHQESAYVSAGGGRDTLLHLTIGKPIRFKASGALTISPGAGIVRGPGQ